MKCLQKYQWVKLPRKCLLQGKGIMGAWMKLVSRAAFRKGIATYCGHNNPVEPGMWAGGVVGLKSILGTRSRSKALETLEKLSTLGYLTYALDKETSVVLKAPEDAVFSQTRIKMGGEDHGSAVPARSQSQSGRTPPQRRRVMRRTPVLAIGDGPTVETEADKARSDLLDLVESQKTGRILTGTIQGVERPKPETSLAVLYHGSFKIIIPAEQAVTLPDDRRGRSVAELYNYMLTKRLGAEIDYIVKGVEPRTGLAAGSRLEAMAAKRREYYGADRAGNRQIHEGVCAEARIVSVIRAGIFVELFGLETYIPLRELSYQRWMDAGLYFQAGQRVLVKVLEVDRSDRNNIRVTASVKQAGVNPYEKALRMYSVDSCYVGMVSMVDINGVFVALDEGVDCLCSYPKRGRPPRGARVTVRILGINRESNRIWGAITHIAAAR